MSAEAQRRGIPAPGPAALAASGQVLPQPPRAGDDKEPLLKLLAFEADVRSAATEIDLLALVANESLRLTRAKQVFILKQRGPNFSVAAITGIASVDRNVPLVQWIERVAHKVASEQGSLAPREFNLSAFASGAELTAQTYPMREALWVPFIGRNATAFGGMLLTRDSAWNERDVVVTSRLAGAISHAWESLLNANPFLAKLRPGRFAASLSAALFAALCVTPVSLTTLAPAEVVPSKPFIVSAPIDGVIADVPADANSHVKKGQVLVRFVDTTLRNRLEVAEREVLVAEARLKTTTQIAFSDVRGKHDLSVARAELALKTAERDYASDLLSKTIITADRDGFAIFGDKSEMVGRPVSVGERLVEIADPANVEIKIEVPIADSIILKENAPVKVFLDSDPLHSVTASVLRSDYVARLNDGNQMSYRVVASIAGRSSVPRLGARGTAQIYGGKVPLIFYVLRRPISTVRQWAGL